MPRKQATAAGPAAVIHDDALYTLQTATAALGLRPGKKGLQREVRLGRLRAHVRLGKYWITGRDLRAWVESGPPPRHLRGRNGHDSGNGNGNA